MTLLHHHFTGFKTLGSTKQLQVLTTEICVVTAALPLDLCLAQHLEALSGTEAGELFQQRALRRLQSGRQSTVCQLDTVAHSCWR